MWNGQVIYCWWEYKKRKSAWRDEINLSVSVAFFSELWETHNFGLKYLKKKKNADFYVIFFVFSFFFVRAYFSSSFQPFYTFDSSISINSLFIGMLPSCRMLSQKRLVTVSNWRSKGKHRNSWLRWLTAFCGRSIETHSCSACMRVSRSLDILS